MTSYANKHSRRDAALDSCGIGHGVQANFGDGAKAIAQTAASLSECCHNQLTHDLLTNVPCGIDCGNPTEHAITQGIASFVGIHVKFDIAQARRFAALILEEVNDHEEAALMFDKAKAALDRPSGTEAHAVGGAQAGGALVCPGRRAPSALTVPLPAGNARVGVRVRPHPRGDRGDRQWNRSGTSSGCPGRRFKKDRPGRGMAVEPSAAQEITGGAWADRQWNRLASPGG